MPLDSNMIFCRMYKRSFLTRSKLPSDINLVFETQGRLQITIVLFRMPLPLLNAGLGYPSGRTDLYLAAQDGHENAVKAILDSTARSQDLLNLAEPVNGWTPLFIACINGYLSIVKLLLEAGAEQRMYDLAGWTEKEHAVFRSHVKVA